jgi:hypothetical protein
MQVGNLLHHSVFVFHEPSVSKFSMKFGDTLHPQRLTRTVGAVAMLVPAREVPGPSSRQRYTFSIQQVDVGSSLPCFAIARR